jgi:hypothetical protein
MIEGYRRYHKRKLEKQGLSDSHLPKDSNSEHDIWSCACFFSKVVPHTEERGANNGEHQKQHHLTMGNKDHNVEHEFNGIFLFGKPLYYFR